MGHFGGDVLKDSGGSSCDSFTPENTYPAIKLSFCLKVWGRQPQESGTQIHTRGPRRGRGKELGVLRQDARPMVL